MVRRKWYSKTISSKSPGRHPGASSHGGLLVCLLLSHQEKQMVPRSRMEEEVKKSSSYVWVYFPASRVSFQLLCSYDSTNLMERNNDHSI